VYATADRYKPAEVYEWEDGDDLGIELAMEQSFGGAAEPEWHLNQDLVIALGLLRTNNEWICPSEDYCVVARLRRDAKGRPVALEIKNEFIRDYLAARGMALRISSYRLREIAVTDASDIGWPDGGLEEKTAQDRFVARTFHIVEGGEPVGEKYAVFNISRTDVDPEDDVPRPGKENDSNTASKSWTGTFEGRHLVRVTGELWRNEWVEPGLNSPRVRGDKIPSGIQYFIDASGTREPSENLEDDDDPRWLWFRPEVMLSLTRRRGGSLSWFTQETGEVSCSPDYAVHFGVNSVGLVTVNAYDIVRLPVWQQRIWAGFNTAPDGGVSKELLSAQMETRVADTTSPEALLPEVLGELDEAFTKRIGVPLFRKHSSVYDVVAATHRFRAVEPGGFLALAKDLVRITADRIDAAAIQRIVPPPPKEHWGSLKSLEKYLAALVTAEAARALIAPLVGAYELRLGDAHLPSEALKEAYGGQYTKVL